METKVTEPFRTAVWEGMLTADFNCRYWGYLCQRYSAYDRNSKIFLAITSSSTVASWSLWAHIDWLWKGLSMVSALIAIAVPYINWEHSIEKILEIRAGWIDTQYEYEKIWRRVQSGSVDEKAVETSLDGIAQKLKPLNSKVSSFPYDNKLATKSQNETLKARGLTQA